MNFFDWWKQGGGRDKPWLILGKGPSFARRVDYDLSAYDLLGLNHVCREQKVRLAHIIDFDVVDQVGEALLTQAEYVVMPWRPHVRREGDLLAPLRSSPTKLSPAPLDQLARSHPILGRLWAEGRLLWYNLGSASEPEGASPVIRVQFFSVEAALGLLAAAGARRARSLGIDGGASYSQAFDDLKGTALLANGRTSFDAQFASLARIIMSTSIDYAPLDVESPVRVFVATTEAQMLSVKVLEYSIRKHASLSVDVFPMHRATIDVPTPKSPKNLPRTPFSFQRFLIPALKQFKGRAIYLDSDMQVFRDIREVWTLPFNGADLLAAREPDSTGRKPQFSVMLLDCEALRWDIAEIVAALDAGRLTYETLMYQMAVARNIRADIPHQWNSLERYVEGETRLLHYTDMTTQPWVYTAHPFGEIWCRDLLEAIDAGAIERDMVRHHVEQGWVRPSLLHQVEQRVTDPAKIPANVIAGDEKFRAPFKDLPRHGGSAFTSPTLRFKSALRQIYDRSGLRRVGDRIRARAAH